MTQTLHVANGKEQVTNMKNSIYKKGITLITSILIMLLSVSGLTGCSKANAGDEANNYDNVVFIGVRQANQVNPEYNNKFVDDVVFNAAYNYGSICQISADGDPRIVVKAKINPPDIHIDDQRRRIEAGNNRDVILQALPTAVAEVPECELLESLCLAADQLHSESGDGIIIIYNNGITTTGDLNFAEADLIHSDPEYIVKELAERHAIPDLKGIDVRWFGLASTAPPQDDLTSEYKYNLKSIWEAILDESGAKYYIDPDPYTVNTEQEGLPAVSTMPVIFKGGIGEDIGSSSIISYDEETTAVRFLPDTAEFVDKAAAAEELSPIADYLLKDTSNHIQVIGSTASVDDEEACLALSRERAQACADLLIACGVSADQISVTGIGRSQDPLRTNDLDANGNLIEEAAKHNRAVFFVRK